jgi:hypothetical protein
MKGDNSSDDDGDNQHDFDRTQMPPNILKGIAQLFMRIWR